MKPDSGNVTRITVAWLSHKSSTATDGIDGLGAFDGDRYKTVITDSDRWGEAAICSTCGCDRRIICKRCRDGLCRRCRTSTASADVRPVTGDRR